MAKVTMPQLGESVAEGTIGKWLKKPGDTVAKYEPLLEVITDKVNAEVPSPYAGVLREILVEEGATVPNNAEIAVIETADEGATAAVTPSAPGPTPTPEAAPSPSGVPPMALEKEPAAAEEDTGGPKVEVREPAAAGPAHGPAGSDERPAPASSRAVSSSAPAPAPAPASAPASSDDQATAKPQRAAATAAPAPPVSTESGEAGGDEPRMTPAVRRLLREHGLSASMIAGTGMGGRLTRDDVMTYIQQRGTGRAEPTAAATNGSAARADGTPPATAPAPVSAAASISEPTGPVPAQAPAARGIGGQQVTFPEGADEVLIPMTQMRKGIAAQMTRALQVPQAYVQMEIDATRLVKVREQHKRDFQAREGSSLSYMPFVAKAIVHALKRNPAFNAHWIEQGLVAKRRINMGVAVAVPDGLIVPVVKDVDQLSIAGINRAMADAAARARANKLRLDDIQGSTFTLDNTGWFGSNMTMPIINVPEVAILTMENITKRPVVLETADGDVIAIRPIMNMVLAIDHRANDGAQAAAFLKDVKDWLESIPADVAIW